MIENFTEEFLKFLDNSPNTAYDSTEWTDCVLTRFVKYKEHRPNVSGYYDEKDTLISYPLWYMNIHRCNTYGQLAKRIRKVNK